MWWQSCRSLISHHSSAKSAQDEGLLGENSDGVTAVTPSSEGKNGRKRRGSVSRLRQLDSYVPLADAPERRPVGRSRRNALREPRRPKLTPELVAQLQCAALGRSLRSLAAEFGISHESVRTVLRKRGSADLAPHCEALSTLAAD